MTYKAGEQGIEALVKTVTGFTSTTKPNVSRSKWGILNTGNSDHYAIIRPGVAVSRWISARAEETTWQTIVQVWQRFRKDGTDVDALEDLAAAVVAKIEQYRFLGLGPDTGVINGCVNRISEIQEMWAKAGGPQWIKIDLLVEWKEQTEITLME